MVPFLSEKSQPEMMYFNIILTSKFDLSGKVLLSAAWGLFVQNFFSFVENVEIIACLGLCFDCGQISKHMIGHLGY